MKEQGSAALRIVAFAVALAVVLGLASVMFQVTASAESTNKDIKTGSFSVSGYFDGYSCLNLGTELSFYDFVKNYNTFGYGFCVIPIVIKNNVTYYYKSNTSWNCYGYIDVYTATSSNGGTIFYSGTNFYPNSLASDNGESYKDYKTVIKKSKDSNDLVYVNYVYDKTKNDWVLNDTEFSIDFYDYKSNTYASNVAPTDIKYVLVSNQSMFLQNKNRNNNWSDLDSIFSDNATFSDAGKSPNAEFVSCKSAPTGYPEGVLWFEDWINEGMQYPYFSWYIRDNGNQHSYSVKFSYNSSQVDTCDKVFNNRFYDELEKVSDVLSNPLFLFVESGVVLAATQLKNLAEKTGLLNSITAIQWKNLSYTDSFLLQSDDMDFSQCNDSGNRVYSVCLSDYSDIGRYFIYRADIIDNVTGQILDTTFFCPLNKFGKGNSGFGSKIYDYGDNGDGMLDDLINNTPSVDPSIKNPFDTSGNVIDKNYGGSLSDINISDIASSLENSINSVSVFFRFCWTLFPSQIWSVILLGLSLIIILRVLGR